MYEAHFQVSHFSIYFEVGICYYIIIYILISNCSKKVPGLECIAAAISFLYCIKLTGVAFLSGLCFAILRVSDYIHLQWPVIASSSFRFDVYAP